MPRTACQIPLLSPPNLTLDTTQLWLTTSPTASAIRCKQHEGFIEIPSILIMGYSTERNQTESPLLRLPAEIRTAIYAYALGAATIRVVRTTPMELRRDGLHSPRTCRQIYKESQPLVDAMTVLSLVHRDIWSPVDLKHALNRQSHSFTNVQELHLNPERAHLFFFQYKHNVKQGRMELLVTTCEVLAQIFPSLQRLVLDVGFTSQTHHYNVHVMRLLFCKAELEIVYAEQPGVLD